MDLTNMDLKIYRIGDEVWMYAVEGKIEYPLYQIGLVSQMKDARPYQGQRWN